MEQNSNVKKQQPRKNPIYKPLATVNIELDEIVSTAEASPNQEHVSSFTKSERVPKPKRSIFGFCLQFTCCDGKCCCCI